MNLGDLFNNLQTVRYLVVFWDPSGRRVWTQSRMSRHPIPAIHFSLYLLRWNRHETYSLWDIFGEMNTEDIVFFESRFIFESTLTKNSLSITHLNFSRNDGSVGGEGWVSCGPMLNISLYCVPEVSTTGPYPWKTQLFNYEGGGHKKLICTVRICMVRTCTQPDDANSQRSPPYPWRDAGNHPF